MTRRGLGRPAQRRAAVRKDWTARHSVKREEAKGRGGWMGGWLIPCTPFATAHCQPNGVGSVTWVPPLLEKCSAVT